ncbi:hypothetical protein CORC01_13095 [Colletotrichum orchidophilum]|uniref:Uncharacterized protein n=1 Tax=Colletotrichum orchidophilum TaxID=1209926 RepID=A0A1G4AR20_9PEZI|nr:uncharacterized protein CORC01_13095 [Colletotrichum orchidophilum]OHE91618.1 hypothetical protein CORC01_13095 [Colletotrichum orchidophilum]
MAQPRMPELVEMVRRQYHRFPSDTWETTRLALENPEPHRLFEHIETLISTRKIDAILRNNSGFRGLMASLYGQRYGWLQDADLGGARWESTQEEGVEDLATRAKEAEVNSREAEARKRDIMLRKIVEGTEDLDRWAKVLGFEGVVFSPAEIEAVAVKMKAESGSIEGEGHPGYGVGEEREKFGGLDATACLDGPEGTYGLSTYVGQSSLVAGVEPTQPEAVPRAPAEGGEAPRNPFTTEWRARDNPGGFKWPNTYDPYYTSGHYIKRSKKYKLPEYHLPPEEEEEEEEEDGGEDVSADEGEERDQSGGSMTPTALAATATTTQTWTKPVSTRITRFRGGGTKRNEGRDGRKDSRIPKPTASVPTATARLPEGNEGIRASVQISGVRGQSPPESSRPVIPSFVVDTRARPAHGETVRTESTTADPSAPSISVTDTSQTERTRPANQSGRGTLVFRTPSPALAPPSTHPRIYTPPRELIALESGSPSDASEDSDVDMIDVEKEDADDGETSDNLLSQPFDEQWLINWLKRDISTTDEDLRMIDYKGWRVHSPKIQLIRIKNFLADEDIDRTLDWERKFAEIGEFLQHCVRMEGATDKDWYVDLREAMGMLRTHWLFEEHHYGEKKLVVNFPEMSTTSTRLPPLLDGRDLVVEKRPKEAVRPRYLLHRVPESVQDVDYQIPGPLLRRTFLRWLREDGNLVWAADPSGQMPGSGRRGEVFKYEPDFNMALTEDEWFAKCIEGGPDTTSNELHGEANFYILVNEYIGGEVNEVEFQGKMRKTQIFYPEGEAQQRFARYRGAKRAALQQCLSHFDSVENVAIQSPFRKLVLPLTKKQKKQAEAEAGRNIVYKPHSIKEPPHGTKLDPLGLAYWHKQMRDSHLLRAEDMSKRTMADHREFLEDMEMPEDTVPLPLNFLGPVTPFNFLKEDEQEMVARYTLLRTLREKLTRAYNKNPRQMLDGVVKNIEFGFQGTDSWDMREVLVAHRDENGDRYLGINEFELYWMDFVCGPSTTAKAEQEVLPNLGREFEAFVARVQTLLDNPSQECLLAAQGRNIGLQQAALALNSGNRRGDYVFNEEAVNKFSRVLADHGRLGYERAETGEVTISRPKCDWHPEHRMNWAEGSDPWHPNTNPWHHANVPDPDDTSDWSSAFDNVQKIDASRDLTKKLLWSCAYRVGIELGELGKKLAYVDQQLNIPHEWEYRKVQLQDLAGSWGSNFARERPGEDGVTPLATYKSVVRAGDPGSWKEDMTEDQAIEHVRRGVIEELSRGDGTLWPSRPRFGKVGGKDVMTLHRERIWDWARPEVCGKKKKQFFSMNRWPVHLQSKERQEEIRRSVTDEGVREQAEAEELRARMDKVEERVKPTPEEIRRAQMARMLSVPYHEGNDERTEFFPGETEFWGGDTESQRLAIEERLKKLIDGELSPNDSTAPRGTGWVSRKPVQVPGSGSLESSGIDPGLVPRSIPSRFSLAPGGMSRSVTTGGGAAGENRPAPATPPLPDLEERRPLFPPRYPPRQGRRRVRFNVEDEASDGASE